jgi:hypothetical protein
MLGLYASPRRVKSKMDETLNEILDKIRSGAVEGSIEIIVRNKDKVNRIVVQRLDAGMQSVGNRIEKPDLSRTDFSSTSIVSGDFSGLDLHESNFSYARIQGSDFSGSYLRDAAFLKANVSQSDFRGAYSVNMQKAYLTGSVNLYGAHAEQVPDIVNAHDAAHHNHDRYDY